MKFTYNWLKDFVEIKIPAKALAEKLTMAGLEVKAIEERNDDFVFEAEITSNRPDWLSIIGIAREVAALTGKSLRGGAEAISKKGLLHPCGIRNDKRGSPTYSPTIKVENPKDCPLYTAKIIKDVKVGPSPEWLKNRLESIGLRSINNIVDITNYILFTYGEPLHAFDLDKITGISVRRAEDKEELMTIDGVKLQLDQSILVISDAKKPIALAGIMGGKESEVSPATKNILLEAAIFAPVIVRRSRQKLGIQTDSSYRFERGVDAETANFASQEAVRLIIQLCGGKLVLTKSMGISAIKKKRILFEAASAEKLLGVKISRSAAKKIFSGLGIGEKMPAFRPDLKSEADLIEELARIYGYEKIPASLPAVYPQASENKAAIVTKRIKNILIGLGLNEAITYSMIDRQSVDDAGANQGARIEILNPLSKEQEILRPTLIPSLLKCVSYNLNQKQERVCLFEIAKAFSWGENKQPSEEPVLAIVLCQDMAVLRLKGVLETLFSRLGIKKYEVTASIKEISPQVLERFDIKNKSVTAVELRLKEILAQVNLEKKFKALPLYPGVSRDISLVAKEEIPAGEIIAVIKEKAGELLEEAKVVDFYRGKQIEAGYKGLTISCLYRSLSRTLIESEVSLLHALACQALAEKFSAKIR